MDTEKTTQEQESTQEMPSTENTPQFDAPFTPQKGEGVKATDTYDDSGWSWGGFMFQWAFAVAIKKYILLVLFVLMFIPFVNIVAWFGIAIFFGLKGREYARQSDMFTNKDQYLGFMKAVDHAGKIFFYVFVAFFVLSILLSFTVLRSLMNAGESSSIFSEMQQMEIQQQMLELERQYENVE
jgi:hypothetical protein